MLIFLIGYMGSGKTTLGRDLAERLGYRFLDMDDLVELYTGMTIREFFANRGEDDFRLVEREVLESLLNETDAVISTGGGTPCHFDNMEVMNEAGMTVYVRISPEILHQRLKDSAASRPLLEKVLSENLKEFIMYHLTEREKYYLQAKLILQKPSIDKLIHLLDINSPRKGRKSK